MNTSLGKLGEILLLVSGLFTSVYTGWWGYILIADRYDLIEKWWQAQPQFVRKMLKPLIKLPKVLEVFMIKVMGIILLTSSLIFFIGFCILLIRNLSEIGK